jgi:hypothetical protein
MEYLLKCILCLLLLLLFYRLFLQQEVLFRFNRFFLLLSLHPIKERVWILLQASGRFDRGRTKAVATTSDFAFHA